MDAATTVVGKDEGGCSGRDGEALFVFVLVLVFGI